MTEEEAKTKWCPHVRMVSGNNVHGDRHPIQADCIASDCMMWKYNNSSPSGKKQGNGCCGLTK